MLLKLLTIIEIVNEFGTLFFCTKKNEHNSSVSLTTLNSVIFNNINSKPRWGTKDFHGPFSIQNIVWLLLCCILVLKVCFYKINYKITSCSILCTSGFNIWTALPCLWIMMQWNEFISSNLTLESFSRKQMLLMRKHCSVFFFPKTHS